VATQRLDAEIDRLYQLPIEEFTASRNALAKRAGGDGSEIRRLQKPSIAAWSVNQLFWRDRRTYDELIEAAKAARSAHGAVLGGRRGDLRAAGSVHEEAVSAALKSTIDILQQSGHPVTDATRQAISATLRALPAGDAPGRLTQPLQPAGFEALAGMPVQAKGPEAKEPQREGSASRRVEQRPAPPAIDARALARAKQAVASAEHALRQAEHTARRDEFEAARATRDAEKATRAVEQTREAVAEAERAFADAQRDAEKAAATREAAQRRARSSEAAIQSARDRLDGAREDLDKVRKGS
jgi:hypothetical protein